jgi:hypothetical protein
MPINPGPHMWSIPAEPDDVCAVRDSRGRLMVRSKDVPDSLWWFGRLGAGVGYEWHEALRFGPLTDASHEIAEAAA